MRLLTVQNFSCIEKASLELRRLTVIIGPQAAGKSVLCKLSYFLIDCAHLQQASLVKLQSFEKFQSLLKSRFIEWFPIEAWGPKKFRIEFTAGDYCITLTRKTHGGKPTDDFRVKISDEFEAQYEVLAAEFQKLSLKTSKDDFRHRIEFDYAFREETSKGLGTLMKKDYVAYQAFVPAGRSFFTSIGKAIAAFEQGRVLDPLILRFGRLYTGYMDRMHRTYLRTTPSELALRKAIDKDFAGLMGGTVERDSDKEYLRTPDGRKIPLSAMSSGQQELLPLLTFMPWIIGLTEGRLCYIEEPEAHLFPSSQSRLIETLVSAGSSGASLVMTTHSPYVITKINNLLKAGAVGRKLSDDKRRALSAVVARRAWLNAKDVAAYAIEDGKLRSILEDDGLIDSDYLDQVSGELSKEFGQLLAFEESIA